MSAQQGIPGRRRDIQALRAVAVAAVVAFHLRPEWVPGGYIGVDAFFVISGFLITAHLLRERESTGAIRLGRFWARRIRRLLPAAVLVLLVTAAATPVLLPASRWAQAFADIGASAGYAVNWVLAANAVDYFAEDAASPVQHYWSLSVEEQFYLIWPVLLVLAGLLARRRGVSWRSIATVTMIVVFVACLAVSIAGAVVAPDFFYFATPAHGWEFAAGGLVAVLRLLEPGGSGRALRSAAAWTGFAGLIASAFVIDPAWGFPGWVALWPVACVVLVLLSDDVLDPVLARVVGWRPVQILGDLSYSLYLWHWPVIVFLAARTGGVRGWLLPAAALAALLLSWLTYRFVENPVRRAPRLVASPRATYAVGALLTVPVLIAGITVSGVLVARGDAALAGGYDSAVGALDETGSCLGAGALVAGRGCTIFDPAQPVTPDPSVAARDHGRVPGSCWSRQGSADVITCHYGADPATAAHTVALIGDSHAGQYADALRLISAQEGWSLTTYLKYSCPWRAMREDDLVPLGSYCSGWNGRVAEELAAQRPELIVTSAYLGDYELDGMTGSTAATAREQAVSALERSWAPELEAGSRVVAIIDNPRWDEAPLDCITAGGPGSWGGCRESQRSAFPIEDPQREAARRSGAELLDLTDQFCLDGSCPAVIGNVVVYRDRHHLTGTYVVTLVPRIGSALDRGWTGG